jgi:hypothetical protein
MLRNKKYNKQYLSELEAAFGSVEILVQHWHHLSQKEQRGKMP